MFLINKVFLAFKCVFLLMKGVPFYRRFDVASIKKTITPLTKAQTVPNKPTGWRSGKLHMLAASNEPRRVSSYV